MPHKKKSDAKEWWQNRYRRRRKLINRYKTFVGCKRCGFRGHAVALDLHHLDGDKPNNFHNMAQSYGEEKMRAEIRKCEVLCANCHRIIHSAS